MSHEPHEVRITEDPAEFLALAEEHLAADPVLTTVVSTVTHRVLAQLEREVPAPPHPRWWAVVRDGAGAVALARAVHARGEHLGGANGTLPAARAVAEEAARLQGGAATIWEHTRLFELGELVEPVPVAGGMRRATAADTDVCLAWFQAFAADAAEQAGRTEGEGHEEYFTREDMVERIDGGRVWLWEVAGDPVHLTGFNTPSFGVARVGPVYTPKEHRGRGYASAGVAEVSRRLLDEGARVCLFTDQANPTSNRIYQALGYRPVVDMANLVVG